MTHKKKYTERIVLIVSFVLLFVLTFTAAHHVFLQKWNCEHLSTFVDEKKNTLDVLFLGSSHMYKSIMTMEMWNRFGIASYNLGTSEQSIPSSYHLLKMALNRQKPKLVVLDLYMLSLEKKYLSAARIHHVFDNMPRSVEWYQGVFDLIPEQQRLEYIIPFSTYHSRWTDLNKKDFRPITSTQKGSEYAIGIEAFQPYTLIPETQTNTIPDIPADYLKRIIELCKNEGIELHLVVLPYPNPTQSEQEYYHSAEMLAWELNVPFDNLLRSADAIGLDFETDFVDYSHLNMMGAYKTTAYLGELIQDKYQIPDHRNNPDYAYWHDDYQAYIDECYQKLSTLSEKAQGIIFPFLDNWFATIS